MDELGAQKYTGMKITENGKEKLRMRLWTYALPCALVKKSANIFLVRALPPSVSFFFILAYMRASTPNNNIQLRDKHE